MVWCLITLWCGAWQHCLNTEVQTWRSSWPLPSASSEHPSLHRTRQIKHTKALLAAGRRRKPANHTIALSISGARLGCEAYHGDPCVLCSSFCPFECLWLQDLIQIRLQPCAVCLLSKQLCFSSSASQTVDNRCLLQNVDHACTGIVDQTSHCEHYIPAE